MRGTYRKDRHALPVLAASPDALTELPLCPKIFDAIAKAVWRRTGEELIARRVLTGASLYPFSRYCANVAKAIRAEKLIATQGGTYNTPTGYPRTRPEVAQARDAWADAREFERDFGILPTGSSGAPAESAPQTGDADEDFLFGTKTG
jgi:P27 family predicted phage terminase small subunit